MKIARMFSSLMFLIWPAMMRAQHVAIGEYSLPLNANSPQEITVGPDHALWFTAFGDCNSSRGGIGRLTAAGTTLSYNVPGHDACPQGITAGPDGALWFTESTSNKIGRITTAGVFTEYPVPTAGAEPAGITAGPDGALWFTETHVGATNIGRITTAGVITEYPLATGSVPWGITSGPDGALWFTESGISKIGRITTAGAVTEYPVLSYGCLYGITAGPDGALWFVDSCASNTIGRITTAGAVTNYPISTANCYPIGIAAGPDGNLWFTEFDANQIGRITTGGAITEYPAPTAGSGPWEITAGPDGALWFTEFYTSKIGEVVFETASLSVTPAAGQYQRNLTFTGSGYIPNAGVQIYVGGVGSAVLASATTDANGSFTATGVAPESVYGPRIFLGAGSGKLGAASFSVKALLIVNPESGTTGSTATVSGYGFGSFEPVHIYWNTPRTLLGNLLTDIHGTFSGSSAVTFTVPSGAAAGANKLFAQGVYSGAVAPATFTVE